ncbi:MAG: NAD(P)/FAD-dependent oxidoreductase [Pyrinomonadaceae bacterium]|nr:NAD(P)/FAD-dependent oxidoreductase [Pyrinomonadaceae bacterium]
MTKRKHEVVIVGGGTAGISVAARLAKKGKDVAIIDPTSKHYYQPLWTLVGGGIVPKESTERSERDLIPAGTTWIKDRVEDFAPDENYVTTGEGTKIEYEYLIVAAGIQIDWDKIKGLPEAIGKEGVCSNYSYEYVDKTWEFIRGTKGGRALFTQPSTPIKCGGAPQKICYLAEDFFRKEGRRDDVEVVFASAGGSIFGVDHYRPTLEKHCEDSGIVTKFNIDLVEIKADTKEAVFKNMDTGELTTEKYDMIHVTPPMSAPDFLKRSPLGNDAGWVDVDKDTLQHVRYDNVFAIGDSSSLPTSKTGAAIRKQVPVLIKNLEHAQKGEALTAVYDGYTSCPLVTGYDSLVMAEFDYDGNPKETFPIDQREERYSMYLVKRYLLPKLYWHGMLKGRA